METRLLFSVAMIVMGIRYVYEQGWRAKNVPPLPSTVSQSPSKQQIIPILMSVP